MEIRVGCSGWFYWHWRGIFYPDTKRTDTWFPHYLAHFDTVELNAPFYKWPKDATVKAWRRNAPDHFRYSVKVNQLITHEKRLRHTRGLVREFYRIEQLLGEKLGCFLFQFPPGYKYNPARLRSIVTQLDPQFRNAVEFRHKSWWRSAVYRAFRKHRLIFCTVSAPRLPDELIKTAADIYVRLHGRSRWYRHDYSAEEIAGWTDRIEQSGADRAWVYFDNDREGYAIKNARMLIEQLNARGLCRLKVPSLSG